MLDDFHCRAFPDALFQVICVWKFRVVTGSRDSASLLRAMINHDAYAYSFIAPYPDPDLGERRRVRGPYYLDQLSPEAFVPISAEEATRQIDEYLYTNTSGVTKSDLDIDPLIRNAIDSADERYRMQADNAEEHTFHHVLYDWSELVLIDQSRHSVHVVTTSSD